MQNRRIIVIILLAISLQKIVSQNVAIQTGITTCNYQYDKLLNLDRYNSSRVFFPNVEFVYLSKKFKLKIGAQYRKQTLTEKLQYPTIPQVVNVWNYKRRMTDIFIAISNNMIDIGHFSMNFELGFGISNSDKTLLTYKSGDGMVRDSTFKHPKLNNSNFILIGMNLCYRLCQNLSLVQSFSLCPTLHRFDETDIANPLKQNSRYAYMAKFSISYDLKNQKNVKTK